MSGGASPRGGTVESVSAYFPPVSSPEITKVINSSATHSFLPSPGGTWTAPLLLVSKLIPLISDTPSGLSRTCLRKGADFWPVPMTLFLARGLARWPHDLYVVLLGQRLADAHGGLFVLASGRKPLRQLLEVPLEPGRGHHYEHPGRR